MLFPVYECLTIICVQRTNWAAELRIAEATVPWKHKELSWRVRHLLSVGMSEPSPFHPMLIKLPTLLWFPPPLLPLCLLLYQAQILLSFLLQRFLRSLSGTLHYSLPYEKWPPVCHDSWNGRNASCSQMLAWSTMEPCIPGLELCSLFWPNWGLFKSSKRCDSLGLIRNL